MILSNLFLIAPEIFLVVTAMGYLLVGSIQGNKAINIICWSAILCFAVCAVLLLHSNWTEQYLLSGFLVSNHFTSIIKIMLLTGLVVSITLSIQYLHQEKMARYEYPVIIMLAGAGMMLMVSASNFLAFYMGLELYSLCLYILTAFQRNSARSGEAGIKYFILGALSSGILLFGISMIYGFSGSLDFVEIKGIIDKLHAVPPGLTVGMVFVLVAIAFKISAAPFHMWTPDAYQGAPTSSTAFFVIVSKIAALAILIRLLLGPFSGLYEQWEQIIYLLALSSLLVGAFGGIMQNDIKRLMAYSSINHMGYMLIGVIANSDTSISAVILYALIYAVISAGVFSVILCMRRNGVAVYEINSLSGLSQTNPLMAYAMAILMFSMCGLPPTAGFFGKLFIFNAAIDQEYYILAVTGVMASVVAAYYYLRIIKVMFFDKAIFAPDDDIGIERFIILGLCIAFAVGFIFAPGTFFTFAYAAATSLF